MTFQVIDPKNFDKRAQPRMTGLGKAMVGGVTDAGRQAEDFYPTPAACTEALIAVEGEEIRRAAGRVWEPACGDGAISRVLARRGFHVVSTDLVDRGYADMDLRADFFGFGEALGPAIVTNPPFKLAERFIRHAHRLEVRYLALLLKSTYWHAAERYALWREHPPAAIYPLTWRPDFLDKGAPTMDCAWMVWRDRPGGRTEFLPLPKPIMGGLDLAA